MGEISHQNHELGFISGDNSWTHSGWAQDPRLLRRIPSWISSRALVLATLIWCAMCVYAAYAEVGLFWGYVIVSVAHLGHYITDSLDGALGRFREEGWIRWGFVLDHFLDTWVAASHFIGLYGSMGRLYTLECMVTVFCLLSVFTMAHLRDIVRLNAPEGDIKTMTYTNDIAGISMVYVRYLIIAGGIILTLSSLLDEPWQIDLTSGPWLAGGFVIMVLVVVIVAHYELGAQDMEAKRRKQQQASDLEKGFSNNNGNNNNTIAAINATTATGAAVKSPQNLD